MLRCKFFGVFSPVSHRFSLLYLQFSLLRRQVSLSLFVGEVGIKRIAAKPHSIRITETDCCMVGFLSGFGSSCFPLLISLPCLFIPGRQTLVRPARPFLNPPSFTYLFYTSRLSPYIVSRVLLSAGHAVRICRTQRSVIVS